MDRPICPPHTAPACGARPANGRLYGAWLHSAWRRALLRLFAELACRLR